MLHASDIYFGLSAKEAQTLAFEFATKLQKVIPSAWITNQKAGQDWFQRFMKRHPKLSMRLPEATSLARALAFNRANVTLFFDNFDKVIQNFPDFNATHIWNDDEMGLSTVHTPNRVVSRRGRKQIGQITSGERGQIVSMALAVNAMGIRAPPYLVFPRVRYRDHFVNGGPTVCWGGANQSGYMNGDNFFDFIQKFQVFTRCSLENPILLLLDNHVSHRTFEVLKFCRENGIHVLSFPPHTSHRLQPLDVAVFSPVQRAANQCCEDWVKSHPGRVMQIFDMPPIFRRALEIGAIESNITAGFAAAGIWPLDRQIFKEIDFLPSATTDRPLLTGDDIPMETDIELPHNRSQQSVDEMETDDAVNDDVVNEDAVNDDTIADDESGVGMGNTSTPMESVQDLSNILEEIKPYPKAPARKVATRGRKPQKSAILTADDSFEKIRSDREAKEAKAEAIAKKKTSNGRKKTGCCC